MIVSCDNVLYAIGLGLQLITDHITPPDVISSSSPDITSTSINYATSHDTNNTLGKANDKGAARVYFFTEALLNFSMSNASMVVYMNLVSQDSIACYAKAETFTEAVASCSFLNAW